MRSHRISRSTILLQPTRIVRAPPARRVRFVRGSTRCAAGLPRGVSVSAEDVPTALIYAREDEFFTPEWERFAARRVLGIEPIEIPGGHFPMIESPDALAELLDGLADDLPR